ESALLLVLGVACTGLAHTLFIASMQRLSAHTASVVAALEPVYGIALAALLLQEIPTVRTLAGGVLIVAAALVASRRSASYAGAMDIGIVGLGRMGGNMARRLARGGVRVTGFDPDPNARGALAADSVTCVDSLAAVRRALPSPAVL